MLTDNVTDDVKSFLRS